MNNKQVAGQDYKSSNWKKKKRKVCGDPGTLGKPCPGKKNL
jgi:hypothetical protein